uniref:SERRATE/Ars2 N-terminal domain-containing protein n=1 Tax=Romanomermis culicivorax TaxID=13658 RepID=A0A915KWI7_ROMCU
MDPQNLFQLKGGYDSESRLRERLTSKLLQGKLQAGQKNETPPPNLNDSSEKKIKKANVRLSSSSKFYSSIEYRQKDLGDMPSVRSAVSRKIFQSFFNAKIYLQRLGKFKRVGNRKINGKSESHTPSTSAYECRPSSVVQVVKSSSNGSRQRNHGEANIVDRATAAGYEGPAYKRETHLRQRSPDRPSHSNLDNYDRPFYEYPQNRSYYQYGPSGLEYSKESRRSCSSEKCFDDSAIDDITATSKNVPEHIKWLHDRWSKYDSPDFFSKGSLLKPADLSKTSESGSSKRRRSPTNQNCLESTTNNASQKRTCDRRHRSTAEAKSNTDSKLKLSLLKSDYMNWHYGGLDRNQLPYLLSFKEFLLSLSEDVGDTETEQIKALNLYTEYKMNFKRRAYHEFFEAHKDEEWFLQKYHPSFK